MLARNFLIATIEKKPQRTLLNCRTAFEMWTRLTSQHLQCAAENKHLLQKQFFDYKYKPGIHKITILHLPLYNYGNILFISDHDIMSHITAVECMANTLSDLDAPVSDLQVMTKITCTLPPSYRHFISAWDNVAEADKTIALLTSRLLKEECMTKMYNNGDPDPSDTAFFSLNFSQQNRLSSNGSSRRGARGASRGRGGMRGGFNQRMQSNQPRDGPAPKRPRVECH